MREFGDARRVISNIRCFIRKKFHQENFEAIKRIVNAERNQNRTEQGGTKTDFIKTAA